MSTAELLENSVWGQLRERGTSRPNAGYRRNDRSFGSLKFAGKTAVLVTVRFGRCIPFFRCNAAYPLSGTRDSVSGLAGMLDLAAMTWAGGMNDREDMKRDAGVAKHVRAQHQQVAASADE